MSNYEQFEAAVQHALAGYDLASMSEAEVISLADSFCKGWGTGAAVGPLRALAAISCASGGQRKGRKSAAGTGDLAAHLCPL